MVKLALALALSLPLASPQASIAVRDLNGRAATPLVPAAGDVNLAIFVSIDCPISARYSPEINRIVRAYPPRHVRTFLIYTDPKATEAAVRSNLKEFHDGVVLSAIIDRAFRLTIAADAKVTPEAAVYTTAGLAYRGRIDDLYEAIGQNRREASHHDLRDALDFVLAGKPVPAPETKPIGCFIERDLK